MNLERITVAIRPRSPWESVDLGFAMVRTWWKPMLVAWLVIVLPIWILGLALLYRWPAVSIFVLWWLRPLFDRVPLFFVSRALFGSAPTLSETLRAWRRPGWRFLLAYLTIFRIDPARSFNLPVGELEGLRGHARRQRLRALSFNSRGTAVALALACLLLEACLLLAAVALLSLLAPETMAIPWDRILKFWGSPQGSLGAHLLFGGAWFFAFTLVESAYVAAGFSLYISRRVQLEGWDIELVFRKLARRVAQKNQRDETSARRSSSLLAGVALLFSVGLSTPVAGDSPISAPSATEAPAQTPAEADPGAVIQDILARPDFETRRTFKRWQRKPHDASPTRKKRSFKSSVGLFAAAIAETLASFLEVFLWFAVALAVGGLIYYFAKDRRPPRRAPPRRSKEVPEVLFGLDVREESLPADIAGSALVLLADGKITEALSLLYRGTLARLVQGGSLEAEASWTEADCLAQARPQMTSERFEIFRRLTAHWCRSAYAHRSPPTEGLERLCQEWRQAFGSSTP